MLSFKFVHIKGIPHLEGNSTDAIRLMSFLRPECLKQKENPWIKSSEIKWLGEMGIDVVGQTKDVLLQFKTIPVHHDMHLVSDSKEANAFFILFNKRILLLSEITPLLKSKIKIKVSNGTQELTHYFIKQKLPLKIDSKGEITYVEPSESK